jgi:hypothetical protein
MLLNSAMGTEAMLEAVQGAGGLFECPQPAVHGA